MAAGLFGSWLEMGSHSIPERTKWIANIHVPTRKRVSGNRVSREIMAADIVSASGS